MAGVLSLRLIASLRWQRAAAILLPIAVTLFTVWRLWPLVDDVPLDGGDDWHFYKRLAVRIVDGGLSIPGFPSYRVVPHGFLYNYFVAGVFIVFGTNSAFVYVAQALLTGLTVSLFWLVAKHSGTITAGMTLLLCGAAVFLDFTNRLSLRLLSENVFLFLGAAVLWLVAEALRRHSVPFSGMAGAALGLAVLSRTSMIAWAVALILLGVWAVARQQIRPAMWTAFTAAFAIAMCLLPLREYAAVGYSNFHAITDGGDWIRPPAAVREWPEYYGRRLLFIAGATSFLEPDYRARPHWMAIWFGVAGYLVSRITRRRSPTGAEALVLLMVPLYLGPVWLVAGVSNYGGRMVAVAMPFAALLAARWAGDYLGSARFLRHDLTKEIGNQSEAEQHQRHRAADGEDDQRRRAADPDGGRGQHQREHRRHAGD